MIDKEGGVTSWLQLWSPGWFHMERVSHNWQQLVTSGIHWPHLATAGHTWQQLDTLRNSWSQLVTPCNSWSHLATPGHTWQQLVTPWNSWSLLAIAGYTWQQLVTPGNSWSHILCPICKLIWLTSNFSLHVRHCQAVEQHPRRWRKKMCIAQMMTSSFPINSSWTMIFLLWYLYFSLPASITSGCIHRFPRARLKLSRFQLLQTSRCWRI